MNEMPGPWLAVQTVPESGPPFWALEALLLAGVGRDAALAQLARLRPEPGPPRPNAAWPKSSTATSGAGY